MPTTLRYALVGVYIGRSTVMVSKGHRAVDNTPSRRRQGRQPWFVYLLHVTPKHRSVHTQSTTFSLGRMKSLATRVGGVEKRVLVRTCDMCTSLVYTYTRRTPRSSRSPTIYLTHLQSTVSTLFTDLFSPLRVVHSSTTSNWSGVFRARMAVCVKVSSEATSWAIHGNTGGEINKTNPYNKVRIGQLLTDWRESHHYKESALFRTSCTEFSPPILYCNKKIFFRLGWAPYAFLFRGLIARRLCFLYYLSWKFSLQVQNFFKDPEAARKIFLL